MDSGRQKRVLWQRSNSFWHKTKSSHHLLSGDEYKKAVTSLQRIADCGASSQSDYGLLTWFELFAVGGSSILIRKWKDSCNPIRKIAHIHSSYAAIHSGTKTCCMGVVM